MKIIKNCAVVSFLLVIMTGCGAKVTPPSAVSSNSSSSGFPNSGGSGSLTTPPPPPPPPPVTNWRTKTVDEVKNFKDADGKNLFQLSIGNPQELKELIQKVGDEKAIEMAVEGDKPYVDGSSEIVTTKSPLRMAIEADDEESLNALLAIPGIEAELDKNINDNRSGFGIISLNNPTFLHLAAREGKVKAFTALIKKDPSLLEKTDQYGESPLFNAVNRDQTNIIEAFLNSTDISDAQKEALLQTKSKGNGFTPLLAAAFNGRIEIFKALRAKFPTLVGQKNNKGFNVAHLAAQEGNESIIKLLELPMLKEEANNKSTVVDIAVDNNRLSVLEALYEKDPDIFNYYGSNGFSPLIRADDKKVAKFILDKTNKEVVQKCNGNFDSVLHQAILNNKKGLIEALVEDKSGKIDLGLKCNDRLPIHNIIGAHNDTIEPFIRALNDEQINAKNSNGYTILHLAAAQYPSKIALLAQNPNLDVNILDTNSNSALAIAITYKKDLPASLLLDNKLSKAHINYINNDKKRSENKSNRDAAIKALLATNKFTKENISKAALTAAYNHDVDSLKALIAAGANKLTEVDMAGDGSIKANALVKQAVEVAMKKWACDVARGTPNLFDYQKNFKKLVTKNTIATLDALNELGLPKEAFSKGILKMDDNTDINWTDVCYKEPITQKVTWHFKEVQEKLKELAK